MGRSAVHTVGTCTIADQEEAGREDNLEYAEKEEERRSSTRENQNLTFLNPKEEVAQKYITEKREEEEDAGKQNIQGTTKEKGTERNLDGEVEHLFSVGDVKKHAQNAKSKGEEEEEEEEEEQEQDLHGGTNEEEKGGKRRRKKKTKKKLNIKEKNNKKEEMKGTMVNLEEEEGDLNAEKGRGGGALRKEKEKQKQITQASSTRSMFGKGFEERHDLEQYFWSEKTVLQLTQALQPTAWHNANGHVCCLATPSLAHAFYANEGRAEALLDIDTRFNYLPGFRFFDLCNPAASDSDDFRLVIFDPPFFYIPLHVLFQAVLVAVHGNLQAKLLVGFLRREEGSFLQTFAPFRLRRTRFVLEYAAVKPNKWRNYALYANIDLPGIRRIP